MSAKKILVVDDELGIRELLRDILIDEGFEIFVAENATEARELKKNKLPDLILLDLMMPELDGYALLEIFSRHIARDEYLPILVLTADATIGAKRKALALGAKDFLTKPFDTIEAMLRVWNLLETRMLYRHLKMLNASIKPLQHGQSQENPSS